MWFTVTLQVSDRACDEGVRVMDKGVEKAGAVLDKGASIKLCNSCCSKPSQIPEKKSAFFNQSLPSSCRLQKALTVAIRSSSYSCRLSTTDGLPCSWLQRTSNRWTRRSQTNPREASGDLDPEGSQAVGFSVVTMAPFLGVKYMVKS